MKFKVGDKVKVYGTVSEYEGCVGTVTGYSSDDCCIVWVDEMFNSIMVLEFYLVLYNEAYLEIGCLVQMRNGRWYMYVKFNGDNYAFVNNSAYEEINNYNSELKHESNLELDVMKIIRPTSARIYVNALNGKLKKNDKGYEVLWEADIVDYPIIICGVVHTEGTNPNTVYMFESSRVLEEGTKVVVDTSLGKQLGVVKWCRIVTSNEQLENLINKKPKAKFPLRRILEIRQEV